MKDMFSCDIKVNGEKVEKQVFEVFVFCWMCGNCTYSACFDGIWNITSISLLGGQPMRIISQDGTIDVPYEQVVIQRYKEKIYFLNKNLTGVELLTDDMEIALYSNESKAQKAMEMLRTAYTGRFVTNADIPDDFNEQLKELMKGGFGTVIVKDTNDSRVEFNNLNGYFQFPQDEDVEV